MAEHVTHSHRADEPEHGSGAYWLVWIALLVLTAITWWTGQMHIPGFALVLALIIAITKATLVVLFFMHLWEQKGVNRIAFTSSLVLVVIMLLGVFGDVGFRLETLLPKREDPAVNRPHASGEPHGGAEPHGAGAEPRKQH
jgi:caa(3)-type oxidase subunit IV